MNDLARWSRFAFAWLACMVALHSQGELRHEIVGTTLHTIGAVVAGAGDFDGDGFADFIVSAPTASGLVIGAGSVSVHSGLDGDMIMTMHGASSGARFGASVAADGDLNCDGFTDVVVGAPQSALGGTDSGRVRVWSGGPAPVLLHDWVGAAPGARLGSSVAVLGDVDGDGCDDVALCAPGTASVVVRSGATGNVIATLGTALGAFGTSCAALGDANGDLVPDVAVITTPGTVLLFSGAGGPAFRTIQLTAAVNSHVAGVGDLDGDGFAEILVGVLRVPLPGSNHVGEARVFSGFDGSVMYSYTGATPQEQLGSTVSGAGDVDADGVPDFMIGSARGGGTTGGEVRLHSGSGGGLLKLFPAPAPSAAAAGDVNADGFDDVLVGSPLSPPGVGSVRVLSHLAVDPFPVQVLGGFSLTLDWMHAGPGLGALGIVDIAGPIPSAPGILAVSFGQGQAFLPNGGPLLIDPTPGGVASFVFPFDGTGHALIPIGLSVPPLAGVTVFVQAAMFNHFLFLGSNGLMFLLGP